MQHKKDKNLLNILRNSGSLTILTYQIGMIFKLVYLLNQTGRIGPSPCPRINTKKEEGLFILPLLILIPALTCSPANTLRSTIGDGALNCRVRHGTGCDRPSFGTGNFLVLLTQDTQRIYEVKASAY